MITASNIYTVYVIGAGDYYNTKKGKTVTIQGLKLNKKFFNINGSDWDISEAGNKAGLVKDDSAKDYYVCSTTSYSGRKRSLLIGGGSRSGQAIDPASIVKSPIKQTKIQLKEAIKKGYVSLTVSDNGAYNIKGAIPDSIEYTLGNRIIRFYDSELYSGFTLNVDVRDPETKHYLGYAYVKFTFKNNTGVGKTAKVIASVTGSNCLTGSAEIGTYTVSTREVYYMRVYNNDTPNLARIGNTGLYSVVTDAPASKGSLDKPNVKLYQVYRDKNGDWKSAALSAKQYTVNKGDELGSNHIAVNTYVTNGKTNGFDFKPNYRDVGVYTGVFALYKTKLTPADISAITISGTEYKVNKGIIESFEPVFTGCSINPDVTDVTAAKAVLKIGEEFEPGYGTNTAAGDKGGSLMIMPFYNEDKDSYEYGGVIELNFKILPAEGITL